MHHVKQGINRAARYIQGMERKKFIMICAGVLALAVIVVITTVILMTNTKPPRETHVTMSGQISCLPHQNNSGVQTLECALGLHTDDDHYYELQNTPQIRGLATGTRVEVTGMLRNKVSSYATAGTINVETIR